jgi:hypothetical protein
MARTWNVLLNTSRGARAWRRPGPMTLPSTVCRRCISWQNPSVRTEIKFEKSMFRLVKSTGETNDFPSTPNP